MTKLTRKAHASTLSECARHGAHSGRSAARPWSTMGAARPWARPLPQRAAAPLAPDRERADGESRWSEPKHQYSASGR